jgi:protein O-GlcNAc transferase
MAWFGKALEILPDWPEAQHNLGQIFFKLGQVDEALGLFRRAVSGDLPLPQAAIAAIIPGSPASDNQAILDARRTWAARQLPGENSDNERSVPVVSTAGQPVRVGYVSSFFKDHNWMKPVWGLINHHDRRLFEVHLFSDGPASSIVHGYCAHPQDRFHDISGISNQDAARLIEQAEIELLIDLNGYSDVQRLPLFVLRPAPVIAGWFNMYATTGIQSYDYLIGDDVVVPPQEEKYYCEKIVRVPGSYLTFEMTYPAPVVVDPPCLTSGAITFGSLASQYKITSLVVEAWSAILLRVPGSSLVLKNRTLGAPSARDFVHGLFESQGISADRVRLRGPSDHFRFLETYGEIDIALDTFPYNGGTTTTEALWQGVPVVAFLGDRWVSRTSASILRAASLGDLIGRDVDEYISIAAGLARSPGELQGLRRSMRSRLLDSSVCDTENFARNMERIYTSITLGGAGPQERKRGLTTA